MGTSPQTLKRLFEEDNLQGLVDALDRRGTIPRRYRALMNWYENLKYKNLKLYQDLFRI